ncbi:MAG: DnaD domain protein [Clostridia bacterium]|nr:DnaD domain protein [Clostridia bacterium]
MAFCSFDENAALFDATPVENMFIAEYMLRAPGDFVKVYLYGLMHCYHPSKRMSLAAMARDMDMTEEEVERAFRYWERDGLVRRVGDNPVAYAYANLKQLTLTRAQEPSQQLYDRAFAEAIETTLSNQELSPSDYNTIYDWVDILELPKEIVIMLLQKEKEESSNGRVSLKYADNRAHEWARDGIRTEEQVNRFIIQGKKREQELRRLLKRLGLRRNPSEDDKALYNKWIDDWGFTEDTIQAACKETTKGAPTMAYLDGILLRQHQLGRNGNDNLTQKLKQEADESSFAKKLLHGLGVVGHVASDDDLDMIMNWRQSGFDDEMIELAVKSVHKNRDNGTLEDVGVRLQRWKDAGFHTAEAVKAENDRIKRLNEILRQVYEVAGLEKRAGLADRKLLCKFMSEYNMNVEIVLLAAEYACGSNEPMKVINRILESWHGAGIRTVEAARAEHESHVRAPQGGRTQAPAQRGQDVMRRYTPEERRKTYSAAVIDFDEEES